MQLHLKIYHKDGAWLFRGLPQHPVRWFEDLADGLECAKRACSSEPALLELYMDGVYAVVHQERGWPHKLCRPKSSVGPLAKYEGARNRCLQLVHVADRLRCKVHYRVIWDAVCRHFGIRARRLSCTGVKPQCVGALRELFRKSGA